VDFHNIIGCINKGSLYDKAKDEGIDTVIFNQSFRGDLSIVNAIDRFAVENGIDIVNFHGARANFLYNFLKERMNIPCVTTVHSDYRYDFENSALKYLVFTPLNKLSLKKFDNFICVSRRIKELLDEKGFKGRKFVVNNGVDTRINILQSREQIRERYGIDENAFVYTMVARLHPIKNHIGFLNASKMLIDEHKDAAVLIVGSGDMERKLKQRVEKLGIEKHVHFAGYQKNPIDYINAGDINVLTSFNETFPLVILEGALVKKAAICSDVGDIKDVLDGSSGFIVDPHSDFDIYMKMKQAYEGRNMLEAMGQKLYETVHKGYTLDKFRERYYDSYMKILSGDKNG
jgi:glycosyltransferase involved in cell wall biosynthesis